MNLRNSLSQYWQRIQTKLFPELEEELGSLTPSLIQVVETLELVRVESHIRQYSGCVGRPPADRCALARAFVAKAVLNLGTTRMLIDRLSMDIRLRRICGFETKGDIPRESTFSRTFSEFASEGLPDKVHKALVVEALGDQLVGHVSRDSTAIEAREKPERKEIKETQSLAKYKRGRPKKDEVRPDPEPTRLARQALMTLDEMLKELPKACRVGSKRNSQGYQESWTGYKLHIDTADGGIPVAAILTSASVHDSQVAIPLATITTKRIQHCYDLMDAAYDAVEIHDYIRSLGHVPMIDRNLRSNKALREMLTEEAKAKRVLHIVYPEDLRYNERTAAERTNGDLKDNFGGRYVRVRGHEKVFCHLMFGILALTARQIVHMIT